jgi:hypothetical protein
MAKMYPEDIRDDCVYHANFNPCGPSVFTPYRVTDRFSEDGDAFIVVVPLDAGFDAESILLRFAKADPPDVASPRYTAEDGRDFYGPGPTRLWVAADREEGPRRAVDAAIRDISRAREIFNQGGNF